MCQDLLTPLYIMHFIKIATCTCISFPSPVFNQMASLSKHPSDVSERTQDFEYLSAKNTNVSNFVSVKLSGKSNYQMWKTQMLCLMETHDMRGIVKDPGFDPPRCSSIKIMKKYQTLLKGWILGSLSEDVLSAVSGLDSVTDVWNKLISLYDPAKSSQQDSAQPDTKDTIPLERNVEVNFTHQAAESSEVIGRKESLVTYNDLCELIDDSWDYYLTLSFKAIQAELHNLLNRKLDDDENTVLHIATGVGHNSILKRLLYLLGDKSLPKILNLHGSTALHIAAIVGNTYAAKLLIEKDKSLLEIKDNNGQTPIHKAYEFLHHDTIAYLLPAATFHSLNYTSHLPEDIGVSLLVNAISGKEYDFASWLVERFPTYVVKSDEVLMAIARTFPIGLSYEETVIYPSLPNLWERITKSPFQRLTKNISKFMNVVLNELRLRNIMSKIILIGIGVFAGPAILILYWIFYLMHILVVTIYFILFKVAISSVEPYNHLEPKKKECEEAKKVLELVCSKIEEFAHHKYHHHYYHRPILEAACQNAYEVVDEILMRWPQAILCKDRNNGYDIIQLATINRSEKIYNLIYIIGKRRSVYRTIEDSCKNNMLHLAGRLAPSHKLQRRIGAALQLQLELQWQEEVRKLVFPTYIAKENSLGETPETVFTKEHKDLMKEAERWMRGVAESCSITAALITTIVFAAAITVPGGIDQQSGIPLFRKHIAFTVFAVSDAVSLFASTTALLVFLSIFTARFAEQDFLVRLPRRLIWGLYALLLSTITMMVAFGATLFLVFCHHKPWMLAPISALACLPVAFFVCLQFPLIVDLSSSTYIPNFGYTSDTNRFEPDDIRFFMVGQRNTQASNE